MNHSLQPSHNTPSQKAQLPHSLRTRDLLALSLLAIVALYPINSVQFGGPSAFLYWIFATLTFLVPCAYVCQWLVQRFPGQGGPYLWARSIFGTRWGFLFAFCFWLPGILATTTAVQSCLALIRYFIPTWFETSTEQGLGIIVTIGVALLITCLPLAKLKNLFIAAALLYLAVFVLLGVAGAWWLLSGHLALTPLNKPTLWQPTGDNLALFGIVYLALFGISAPLIMSGEVLGGKESVRRNIRWIWWTVPITVAAYLLGTFGVMVIVPAQDAGQLPATLLALHTVFGSTVSLLAAVVLIVSFMMIIAAHLLMLSRLLIALAADGLLPSSLTRVNRYDVPVRSIVVQAIAVVILTIVPYVISPAFIEHHTNPLQTTYEIFSVMQASSSLLWTLFKIGMFLFIYWLLARPHWQIKLSSIHQAPVPALKRTLLLIAAGLGIVSSLSGMWATLSSSWLPDEVSDRHWIFLVLGTTAAALIAGWAGSELPRLYTVLGTQRRLTQREATLRSKLEDAYREQQILVQQQQELLKEVNRLYEEQAKAAVTDPVTGYPNYRAIMTFLDEEIARCQREKSSCAVLFIDLDRFKAINDSWGHRAGDAILQMCAARLRRELRTRDFLGRYGGEEFAIILTDCDVASATRTAEHLRQVVSTKPYSWQSEDTASDIPIYLTASIGIAIYALHGATREALIKHADRAMYRAKHTGRNRVSVADLETEDDTWPMTPPSLNGVDPSTINPGCDGSSIPPA